jgi:hypothetical protein
VLTHEGFAVPDKQKAVCWPIAFHLNRFAAKSVDPIEQLGKQIVGEYWTVTFVPKRLDIAEIHMASNCLLGCIGKRTNFVNLPKTS